MSDVGMMVAAARQGDLDAFNAVVRRFQGMAYAVAYDRVGDTHLAEDAAQEAFLEAYFALASLREPAAFPGWFRRIVVKQSDRLTRGPQPSLLPLEAAAALVTAEPEPASAAEQRELQMLVRAAIDQLPAHERLATLLFYLGGYSYQELTEILEVPLTTVKKRLHDARAHLKTRLATGLGDYRPPQPAPPGPHFPQRVQLLLAIRTGDLPRVDRLLRQDPALVNTHTVAGDWATVQSGPHVLPVGHGYTPLHWAATNGQADLVRLLLRHGAAVGARAPGGETPLHQATLHHHLVIMRLLLAHGADPDAASTIGMRPLHHAAIRAEADGLALLLAAGATVDAADRFGRTPLHWAAIKGHAQIADALCAAGADPRRQDATGRTPAAWAATRGHAALAARLGGGLVELVDKS